MVGGRVLSEAGLGRVCQEQVPRPLVEPSRCCYQLQPTWHCIGYNGEVYKTRQWIFMISSFPLFLAHLSLPSLPSFTGLLLSLLSSSSNYNFLSTPSPPPLLSPPLPFSLPSLPSILFFLSPPPLHPQTGKTSLTFQQSSTRQPSIHQTRASSPSEENWCLLQTTYADSAKAFHETRHEREGRSKQACLLVVSRS